MKFIALIAAAAASLSFAGTAAAQAYVGGSVGFAKFRDCEGDPSCDSSGSGYKLFGGYKINQALAVELGYFNFGKLTDSTQIDEKGTTFGVGVAFSGDLAPNVVGTARIGIGSNKYKLEDRFGTSITTSTTQPYFGLALGYRLNKQVTLEGGIDFTRFKDDVFGLRANSQLYTVGAQFAF
jgi:OOP family OmpA-OmpF porin